MNAKLCVFWQAILLCSLGACGGGGGGGGGGDFIGVWGMSLSYSAAESTCGVSPSELGLSHHVEPLYQINQNGSNIAAENMSSGYTMTGSTVDDGDGVIATHPEPGIGCPGGSATTTLVLANLDGDYADCVMAMTLSCPTYMPPQCDMVYIGGAYRE
ncbi:MAG TPA: hypothetical protein PLP17_10455 [Oligoflexia bacterium]|nr:hypothetical protein [Oligoflexia bacterium]